MKGFIKNFVEPFSGPWYYPVVCEKCLEERRENLIEYIPDFTWIDGKWICSGCKGEV